MRPLAALGLAALLSAGLLPLAALAAPAVADVAALAPVADTYVDSASPSKVRGAAVSMEADGSPERADSVIAQHA